MRAGGPVNSHVQTVILQDDSAWPVRFEEHLMWFHSCVTQSVQIVLLSLICRTALAAGADPATPPEPSTYLSDAPDAPTAAQAEQGIAATKGWTRLEEDDKKHAFAGQPVFMNDKVVAVLG